MIEIFVLEPCLETFLKQCHNCAEHSKISVLGIRGSCYMRDSRVATLVSTMD